MARDENNREQKSTLFRLMAVKLQSPQELSKTLRLTTFFIPYRRYLIGLDRILYNKLKDNTRRQRNCYKTFHTKCIVVY